jgi:tetratricopeptide (TPR) repeat protein
MKREGAWDRLLGAFVFLGSGLVFLLTISRGVYPGESADYVGLFTGLVPQLQPDHALWGLVVRAVTLIPFGGPTLVLNVFSVLCAAAAVWLMYDVLRRALLWAVVPTRENAGGRVLSARLGGAVGAVALAFSGAFWQVANRAHYAGFDLLALLALVRLLLAFAASGRLAAGCALAFFYGVFAVEYSALYAFLPLFAGAVLMAEWQNERWSIGRLSALGLCGLGGLALCFFGLGALYLGTDGYLFGGYTGYGSVLWRMMQIQYFDLSRSLPRVGWLLIVCFSIVPSLAALMLARRSLNEERDWGLYFVHLVFTASVLVATFRPFPAAVWPDRLVTPQALVAALYGYLVAYWFLVPAPWADPEQMAVKRWLGRAMRYVFVTPLLLAAAWGVYGNWARCDGRQAGPMNAFAEEVVDRMGSHTWLVSDGRSDVHLLDAARRRGKEVRTLALGLLNNEAYMKALSRNFDRPELRNLALIGGDRLLAEWLQTTPGATGEVCILSAPDYWIETGHDAVPHAVLYEGVPAGAPVDLDALWKEHEAFWSTWATRIDPDAAADPSAKETLQFIRGHTARVANDLGVFLEDRGRADLALKAYRRAQTLDPENVSSLLNLAVLAKNGTKLDDAADIEKRLVELASDPNRLPLWRLASTYGYVREPNAFAQAGWVWTFSGRRGLAVANLKRAMAMGASETPAALRELLATTYLAQDQEEKSRDLYMQVLQTETNNVGAMVGLARIAVRDGDLSSATNWLNRAQAAGAPASELATEKALAHVQAGDLGEARAILERLLERSPDSGRAWAILASLRLQQGDELGFEDAVMRLRSVSGGDLVAALLTAQKAILNEDGARARRELETALRIQPGHQQALETLLRLDVGEGRKDDGRHHARQLLKVDPGNAFAYWVLGSIQLQGGETELAADSFRRSLARRRSVEALNDLAWLLYQKGELDEALSLARECVTVPPEIADAWDTLGVILMAQGKIPEARSALEKALMLAPQAVVVQLHYAELLSHEGKTEELGRIVATLKNRWNELSLEQKQKLDSLKK